MSSTLPSNESHCSSKKKIIVLGSGPNRIGQGIEFDYCCVHGLLAIKECGYEAIMINCNPETVSTDFDIADKLYFEPVYWEHLWEIIELEQPEGVIVQLGGQTALKLSRKLHERGIKIIGTSFDNMDIAEDRGRFSDRLKELEIPYPEYGTAHTADEAIEVANKVGYPVLVRPSYVLGGQRMRIVINDDEVEKAVISLLKHLPGNTVLIDHFLDRCQEAVGVARESHQAHGALAALTFQLLELALPQRDQCHLTSGEDCVQQDEKTDQCYVEQIARHLLCANPLWGCKRVRTPERASGVAPQGFHVRTGGISARAIP